TPLLFSIHEAKGLEYENIVLYRFVSDHRAEFSDIADGVRKGDLAGEQLDYRRARDKSDKSLEVYKFFVNALYVALTRAIRNLYLVESDTQHPLFDLMDLSEGAQLKVVGQQSSQEDWQKEARKLELQGKQEQADAIRRTILKEVPVPWPVFDQTRTEELLCNVFRAQALGGKLKQQLYDIATCHDEPVLAAWLVQEAKFDAAKGFRVQRAGKGRTSYALYFAHNFKEILRQCDRHGVEHRLPMNMTPLMAAAAAGNVPLVEALVERGADREATDHFGHNALHWAMRESFLDPRVATGLFARLYACLAPASVDVNTGERLVRIDRHLSEYFLFQTLWVLFKTRFTYQQRQPYAAFETQAILQAWQHLPPSVLRPERNKRQHLSGVLARNEVERDYAYNRALFQRVAQGWYQFNPKLSVRRKVAGAETWVPLFRALNLPFINEFALQEVWTMVDRYLMLAGLPERSVPIAAERALDRQQVLEARRAQEVREQQEALELRIQAVREAQRRLAETPAPWGTAAAKRQEIERVRREIEARKQK
ncbi:MAG: ankyrin repeat domain-containing protein, partial [Burkholderiaceae bacterium]